MKTFRTFRKMLKEEDDDSGCDCDTLGPGQECGDFDGSFDEGDVECHHGEHGHSNISIQKHGPKGSPRGNIKAAKSNNRPSHMKLVTFHNLSNKKSPMRSRKSRKE
jgi:hypothetical protein